jgi:DNA-binding PadR family transcriptional regulator
MAQETGLSRLSLALLGLIFQQPQTGYDIRRLFATTPVGHISNSPGAIYPALKRIERAGWIRGRTGQGKTQRQRVVYEITARGRTVLKHHLARPITKDDIVWHMDDLILRFAFMDQVLGPEPTARFLRDYAREIDAHVADLRRYLDGVRDLMPTCGRLALENGIQGYEMNAQWARRAMKELQGSP